MLFFRGSGAEARRPKKNPNDLETYHDPTGPQTSMGAWVKNGKFAAIVLMRKG